jgi:uncharacterized protein (DUF433 family)
MTALLTTTEVASLTGLDERRIRKDVEYGLLPSPPRFDFAAVVYFRALARLGFEIRRRDRKQLLESIRRALDSTPPPTSVPIGTSALLKLAEVAAEVRDRISRFERWKAKLVTDDKVLGGETTFPQSRLAVRQIGSMLVRGVSTEEIREDYPYLTDEDLEFARLFTVAYPRLGRPPKAA